MKDSSSLVEFKIAYGDIHVGLNWLILRPYICTFGKHLRINIRNRFVRFISTIMPVGRDYVRMPNTV